MKLRKALNFSIIKRDMTTMPQADYRKATQAINFFAQKESGRVNKMKAIKLIYLADRYHLRKYGRPVTNDFYIAMKYGPVGSKVKDLAELSFALTVDEREYAEKYIDTKGYSAISKLDFDDEVFSETDLEALEFAYKHFGSYDEFKLADVTHDFPEWAKYEEQFSKRLSASEIMDYEDFFDDMNNKSNEAFAASSEDLASSKEVFNENRKIQDYLR